MPAPHPLLFLFLSLCCQVQSQEPPKCEVRCAISVNRGFQMKEQCKNSLSLICYIDVVDM